MLFIVSLINIFILGLVPVAVFMFALACNLLLLIQVIASEDHGYDNVMDDDIIVNNFVELLRKITHNRMMFPHFLMRFVKELYSLLCIYVNETAL